MGRETRPTSDGLQLTKLGRWFLVLTFVLLIAATNTGNNGLFLAVVMMVGATLISHLLGSRNVRGLRLRLSAPLEIFAKAPVRFGITVENTSRWLPRWLLVLSLQGSDFEPEVPQSGRRSTRWLTARLAPRRRDDGQIETLLKRRGRYRIHAIHVASPFPIGLFSKGMHYPTELEILVYPEVFAPGAIRPSDTGRSGDEPTRRSGWGHDLQGLRPYRHGDDPRSIHWKQSARIGELIFKEHESEQSRRMSILFDNGVGTLDENGERRFERLVSEAATASLAYLDAGYEVSLVTRSKSLGFAAGTRQRRRILETLALVEPVAESEVPLAAASGRDHATQLRLAMEGPGLVAGGAA